ncbi:MAG TPA: tetratricopeptide repeat protein [Candidatus Limnocylindrales bacterium]|nr:tetratricopeptide repeat protein [Candidatus Limnocylindrales bacterium]
MRDAGADRPQPVLWGSPWPLLLGVWSVAFALRFLHNEALLADPLYFNPLGGNLPFLEMAREIARGDLVPGDGPFTINGPLYPYFLALLYGLFGTDAFYEVRLVGAGLDACTCAMVAHVARAHFGRIGGWAAGVSLALYGPMIFFATDLNPVPLTLFLLTAAIVLLDGPATWPRFGAAGLALGLAAGTRPDVVLAGGLAVLVPYVRRMAHPRRLAAACAAGVALGVAPVTALNWATSGRPVLLTTSGGHNFYIGHNPAAQPQYALPALLDGDIFASMKALAENVEGRPFSDAEVSGYYLREGLAHFRDDPARELELFGMRALLLVNDFEATTYSNYDYQRHYSLVLGWAPTLSLLLLLGAPGAIVLFDRRYAHLWIPLLTAALTVLAFFYIARLRITVAPSLGLFVGASAAAAATLVRRRAWRPLAVAASVGLVAFGVSSLPLLRSDTSNEWNKAGGVLRLLGRHGEAETALQRAVGANPSNANTFRNLAVLYTEMGRLEEARAAEARAAAMLDPQRAEADAFRDALGAGPR